MKLASGDRKLIQEAINVIIRSRPVRLKDTGDVGAALITPEGNVYSGVCLGFQCGIGTCGEYQAIGAMISGGEKVIRAIVAVWFDDKTGRYQVIPPCGKCRETISQICRENRNTEVIISESEKVKLSELLPHPWEYIMEKGPDSE
ncbi:MAG: cytidine deaminase [Candidatus Wallbacteria bacterium]|nr:cytidine deaminase [Candidatus Wallbacteria bacterium]